MRSAPATRCSPTRRLRSSRPDRMSIATILGSMAAACECEHDGNIPVTPANVLRKIDAHRAPGQLQRARPGLKVIVVGLGVQGHKRRAVAGADFVATVDPVNPRGAVPPGRGRAAGQLRRGAGVHARRAEGRAARLPALARQARAGRKAAVGASATRTSSASAGSPASTGRSATPPTTIASSRTSCACATSIASGVLGQDLPLPHVLRQRHGAPGARFGLARPGRGRAAGPRLASARHRRFLVRRARASDFQVISPALREPRAGPRGHRIARHAPAAAAGNDAALLAQPLHLRRLRASTAPRTSARCANGARRPSRCARACCPRAGRPRSR